MFGSTPKSIKYHRQFLKAEYYRRRKEHSMYMLSTEIAKINQGRAVKEIERLKEKQAELEQNPPQDAKLRHSWSQKINEIRKLIIEYERQIKESEETLERNNRNLEAREPIIYKIEELISQSEDVEKVDDKLSDNN